MWVAGSGSPVPGTGPRETEPCCEVGSQLDVLKLGPPSGVRCRPCDTHESAWIKAVPQPHGPFQNPRVQYRCNAFPGPVENMAFRSRCYPSSDGSGASLELPGQGLLGCPRKKVKQACKGHTVNPRELIHCAAVGPDRPLLDEPSDSPMTYMGKNPIGKNGASILQPRQRTLEQAKSPQPPEQVSNAAQCSFESSTRPPRPQMIQAVASQPAAPSMDCRVKATGGEGGVPRDPEGAVKGPAIPDPLAACPSRRTHTSEQALASGMHSTPGSQPASATDLPTGKAAPLQSRDAAAQTSELVQPRPVPAAVTSADTLACLISSLLHEMRQRPLPPSTTKACSPCRTPPKRLVLEGKAGACQPERESASAQQDIPEKPRQTDCLVVTLKATLIERGRQEEGRKRFRTAHRSLETRTPPEDRCRSHFPSENASRGLCVNLANATRQPSGQPYPPQASHSKPSTPEDKSLHKDDKETAGQRLGPGTIAAMSVPANVPIQKIEEQVPEHPKQVGSFTVLRSGPRRRRDKSNDGRVEARAAAQPGTDADRAYRPSSACPRRPRLLVARPASLSDACTAGGPDACLHLGGAARSHVTEHGVGLGMEGNGGDLQQVFCRSTPGFSWAPAPTSSSRHWGYASRARPSETAETDASCNKERRSGGEGAQPLRAATHVTHVRVPGKAGLGDCRHHALPMTMTAGSDENGGAGSGAREESTRPTWPAVTSWLASLPPEVSSLFAAVCDLAPLCRCHGGCNFQLLRFVRFVKRMPVCSPSPSEGRSFKQFLRHPSASLDGPSSHGAAVVLH